ncbi:hypothetical protein Hanom_Chr10g00910961 [Helianthus anomalus]
MSGNKTLQSIGSNPCPFCQMIDPLSAQESTTQAHTLCSHTPALSTQMVTINKYWVESSDPPSFFRLFLFFLIKINHRH